MKIFYLIWLIVIFAGAIINNEVGADYHYLTGFIVGYLACACWMAAQDGSRRF